LPQQRIDCFRFACRLRDQAEAEMSWLIDSSGDMVEGAHSANDDYKLMHSPPKHSEFWLDALPSMQRRERDKS
jgi:hypothetical protein